MVEYAAATSAPTLPSRRVLDEVNDAALAKGEGRLRLRVRLPRGHLRLVFARHQRQAARPGSWRDAPARFTCAASRTAITFTVEPWRARLPDRKGSGNDRSFVRIAIIQATVVSVNTGALRRQQMSRCRNLMPSSPWTPPNALAAAACAAACKNASAMLFRLRESSPPGCCLRASRNACRVAKMVARDGREGFGISCTNQRECEGSCPNISYNS